MNEQKGFTIIELLIATTVFATVLLAITYGLLQIGRTYYKGITSTKTQQAARNIMDDISRTIQFSKGTINTANMTTISGGIGRFCIGDRRYTYQLDRQLVDTNPTSDQATHILVADKNSGCTANRNMATAVTGTDRELMEPLMRLGKLNVQPVNAANSLWKIDVTVISGERDLLRDSDGDGIMDGCANVLSGTQFCAVSALSTIVQQRL